MMVMNKKMDLFIKDNFKMEFQKVKENCVEKIKNMKVYFKMENLQIKI